MTKSTREWAQVMRCSTSTAHKFIDDLMKTGTVVRTDLEQNSNTLSVEFKGVSTTSTNKNRTKSDNKSEQLYQKIIDTYNRVFGRTGRNKIRNVSDKAKRQLKARYKERKSEGDFMELLERVMQNAANDEFHKEKGYSLMTIEFLSRPDKFDRYASQINKGKQVQNVARTNMYGQ